MSYFEIITILQLYTFSILCVLSTFYCYVSDFHLTSWRSGCDESSELYKIIIQPLKYRE